MSYKLTMIITGNLFVPFYIDQSTTILYITNYLNMSRQQFDLIIVHTFQ